jgi:hypothetical protein
MRGMRIIPRPIIYLTCRWTLTRTRAVLPEPREMTEKAAGARLRKALAFVIELNTCREATSLWLCSQSFRIANQQEEQVNQSSWEPGESGMTAAKEAQAQKTRAGKVEPPMPVILRNAPSGYNWGWYSREDPRMHLQVLDRKHGKLGYKVWLESKGNRVVEAAATISAQVWKALKARIESERTSIESEWVHMMIEQQWLTFKVNGPVMTLIAYPGTPNRFERTLDLTAHLGTRVDAFKPGDVRLNSEFAVIELWPRQPESRRPFIPIAPVLWHD